MSDNAIESIPVSPARNTDPFTSHLAAKANPKARGSQRRRVFEYLKSIYPEGATDFEMHKALGIVRTGSQKRRLELQEIGLVTQITTEGFMTRKTDTGSPAIVWVLTEAGLNYTGDFKVTKSEKIGMKAIKEKHAEAEKGITECGDELDFMFFLGVIKALGWAAQIPGNRKDPLL